MSNLGKIGDRNSQNTKIFLVCGCRCGVSCVPLVVVFHRVHLCRCASFLGFRTCRSASSGPLVVCSVLLPALSLCLWCVVYKYGSISRFKGVFSGFWAFRVGLCVLRALRGLCGFCTRVELVGFMSFGVFAPVFIRLPICFCLSF